MLGLAVSAAGGPRLPFIGIVVGPWSKQPAARVSAIVAFLSLASRAAILRRTPGGLWADPGFDGFLEGNAEWQASVDLEPGATKLLLVAAKVEGESACYALDRPFLGELLLPDRVIADPEVMVHVGLKGVRIAAEGAYRLENPGLRLEEFELIKA